MLSALLLGLSSAVPCRAADEFMTDMRKAEGYKEDPDKIEFYGRAISAWAPGDGNALLAECHFRRGEAHFREFEYAAAEPDLSKAVELDPMNGQARLLRGRARLKTGRPAAGLADLVEFTASNPEHIDGLLWLGEAYRDNAQFPQALHAFDRASKLDASDYRPALGRGRVWLASLEWDKAAVALKAADALAHHKAAEILSALGDCEAGRGRRERALGYFDESVQLHEARLSSLTRGGAIAAELGDYRTDAASAHKSRAEIYESMTRSTEALADYRRACELGAEPACRKADALAAKPARPSKNFKKASAPSPSDPGDRVYAN